MPHHNTAHARDRDTCGASVSLRTVLVGLRAVVVCTLQQPCMEY